MREAVAFAVAAVVAVAAVLGGISLIDRRADDDLTSGATVVAQAYAEAWSANDLERMTELVRELPDEFRPLHERFAEELTQNAPDVSVDGVETGDGLATATLRVTVEVPDIGQLEWVSPMELIRERGDWGVQWTPAVIHPDLRKSLHWEIRRTPAVRASILDREGRPLTAHGTIATIGIEPRRITDEAALRRAFEAHLPDALDDLDEVLARSDLRPTWFYPVVTLQPARFESVEDAVRPLDGIVIRTVDGRVTQGTDFAVHVLGRVGRPTAEQLAELGPGASADDEVGLYGLERELEDTLVGGESIEIVLAESDGDVDTVVATLAEDPPMAVTTTLDLDIQRAAENAVVGRSDRVAIVAVDPTTGDVLASVSRPATGFNRAFDGRYAPGATATLVTAAAALRDGGWGLDDSVTCPARVSVGGVTLTNPGELDLGEVSLLEAFAASCETSFAQVAAALDAGVLRGMATELGFGRIGQLALPAFGGEFPQPRDSGERAAAGVGEAQVLASPLGLASLAGAVADGRYAAPRLLADAPRPDPVQVLDGRALDDVHALLRRAVTNGTASELDLPGREVHAQTGRAPSDGPTPNAWVIGFDDDLAFAVLVEEAGSGGRVAAPLARRFLAELAALNR